MYPQAIIIGSNKKFGMLTVFNMFEIKDKLNTMFIPGMNIRFERGEITDILLKYKIVTGIVNMNAHKVADITETI